MLPLQSLLHAHLRLASNSDTPLFYLGPVGFGQTWPTAPSPQVAPGFPVAPAPLVPQPINPLPAVAPATIPPPTFVPAAQALLEAPDPVVIITAMPAPPTTAVPAVVLPPPALPPAPVVVSSTAAWAELLKLDSI
jgi:hypothetical protein